MTALRHSFTHIKQLPSVFWVIIAAVLANQLGNMALFFLVPYLATHFTLPFASFAYASCCAGLLVGGFFSGMIANRIGAVKLMTITLGLNALIVFGIPMLTRFWSIELTCILWGSIFGLFRPATQTFLSYVSSPESYKITFSIYRLANNLGLSVGPAIGGYLAVHSFPLIFIFNGSANIVAALILILGLTHRSCKDLASTTQPLSPPPSFRDLKQDPILRIFLMGMIPISMVFYQLSSTLPIFIHEYLHFPLSFYGLLFTFNTLLIVFFELPLNIATLHWSPRRNMIVGSFLISLGYGGYAWVSQSWEIFLLTGVWTLGEMILFPAATAYIAQISTEKKRANYISLFTTITNLGLFLGPWAGAVVMQHWASTGLWLTCGAWGVVSIILFYFLR